jgi:hypothetical protein
MNMCVHINVEENEKIHILIKTFANRERKVRDIDSTQANKNDMMTFN